MSETLPHSADRRPSPGGWRVLQKAHDLWRAGNYSACLADLDGEGDVLALVLRGRALLRLGRPRDVIGLLHDVETPAARVVLATAFARARDQGSAREIADALRATRTDETQMRAEVARCCAVIAWMGGDTDRAESDLEDALVDPAPVARAAYYQLRSWIAARRENYAEQAHLLTMAARHLLEDAGDDVGLLADITRTLATLNRDLPLPQVAPLVERLVADIPWTGDLAIAHFNAVRDLGWHHALHGRFLPALRLLHRAEVLAPSRAWAIMALVDRAQLARWAGEPASSQATLLHALDLIPDVVWDSTDDEERSALLVAADACSEVDALRAHALLERFDGLAGGFAPRLAARADRRVGAHRALVAGAVQHALGHDAAAVESYRAAYVGFSELGYKWRAAICAGRLFALTRERSWHALGSELVREYPDGWIARDLATAGVDIDDAVRCLTPREREVLQSLLSGMRVTQIAGKLNISPHTAKHHATAIYRAFGVESQSELMAEAKRRRLV